jgi:outer membrane lipoprotein SlyB
MRAGIRSLGLAALIAALAMPIDAQQLYVYPSKGQTPEQQAKDTQECQGWAVQQAGSPYGSTQQQPSGGVVRGAAGGAMLGAVGGAIAGDAGQGAAIGAATGALFGGIRQHRQRQQQYAQQQNQADAYNRALAACLQGRGYTVN